MYRQCQYPDYNVIRLVMNMLCLNAQILPRVEGWPPPGRVSEIDTLHARSCEYFTYHDWEDRFNIYRSVKMLSLLILHRMYQPGKDHDGLYLIPSHTLLPPPPRPSGFCFTQFLISSSRYYSSVLFFIWLNRGDTKQNELFLDRNPPAIPLIPTENCP